MNRFMAIALGLVLTGSGAAAQETPIDLRWKLRAGETLIYSHSLNQHFQFSSDDGAFEYRQTIEATEKLEVLRVTLEGNFEVRQSLAQLKVTVDDKVVFDSDAPGKGDPATAPHFKKAMGNTQSFTMSPLGRPIGPESADVKFGLSGQAEDPLPMAVLSLPLPDAPVAKGKTWEITAREDNQQGCAMVSTSTYRIDGAGPAGHTIRGETTLKLDKAPETMNLRKGDGRQRVLFDLAAGALTESELTFGLCMENKLNNKLVRVTSEMNTLTRLKERKK